MTEKPIRLLLINRTVAVIKPKAPFLAWIRSIPDLKMREMDLEKITAEDQIVFLLPEYDTLEEARDYVDKIHKTIFEVEFEMWWTDPADWPPKTTIRMFHEWFEVEYHSMVLDTTGDDYLVMEY